MAKIATITVLLDSCDERSAERAIHALLTDEGKPRAPLLDYTISEEPVPYQLGPDYQSGDAFGIVEDFDLAASTDPIRIAVLVAAVRNAMHYLMQAQGGNSGERSLSRLMLLLGEALIRAKGRLRIEPVAVHGAVEETVPA